MKNLSRADLLHTLYALKDRNQPDAPLPIEKALGACLGFQYEKAKIKREHVSDNARQENNNNDDDKRIALAQMVAKNRFWYINVAEPITEEKNSDKEQVPPLRINQQLKQKRTTVLASLSLKSAGEWQNVFDASLKQAQKSKKTDVNKSIIHLSKNKPADNLPVQKNYGFNKTVCIVMERTEELRPIWDDMREIWQRVEQLVGEKNLIGYTLTTGIEGCFTRLTARTPDFIHQLEADTLIIYIGAFGALDSAKLSSAWRQHLKQQQKKACHCQLYSACPIDQSLVKNVYPLDSKTQQTQALSQLVQSIKRVWLIDDKQLRYLREETKGANLHTELLAFNHENIARDSQFLWHKHHVKTESNEDVNTVKSIVAKATQRWKNSRSDIAVEMEQLVSKMYSEAEPPELKDYPHLENLAATSQELHTRQKNRNISLSLLRSILPDLEELAKIPELTKWQKVMHVAQQEAKQSGFSLPLGDKGLQSTILHYAIIRQQGNYLQLARQQGVNPAQNLLSIGNQAYCEETNRIIQNRLPLMDKFHIKDQGMRYQLAGMRKPNWAERIWHNASGLHAAHTDGTEFQLKPATHRKQSAQWQGVHNAWAWASDYGIDDYGLWTILTVKAADFHLRWIPAGTFLMGSPEDEKGRSDNEIQHKVTLSKGYWLAETSCTQQQWQAIMGNNPSISKNPQFPVTNVSWDDCQQFIKKLAQHVPDFYPKLPTEAQWGYACRAGTTTAYWWGGVFDKSKANNGSKLKQERHYPANAFGLRSMSGNVCEWCNDYFGDYPKVPLEQVIVDPQGANKSSLRVLRGGSWLNGARDLRAAYRFPAMPHDRYNHGFGLRLAGGFDPQASNSDAALTADRRAQQKPVRWQSGIADKLKGLFN